MTPWTLLDTAPIPDGGGRLRLLRRGSEYVIRLDDGAELMSSRVGGSEEALARLGCAGLAASAGARVLIGGLGMGFTVRAALGLLGPDAAIVVAELVPAVVAWGRGALANIHAGSLDDPRVTILETDVGQLIRDARGAYDAILLDVDNGPDGLTRQGNDALYDVRGLGAALAALRPRGTLAVWSATPDESFTLRLRRTGFVAEAVAVRAHGTRGRKHFVWVASKPGPA